MSYGDLFVAAIQHYGVLLIGLYRLRDATLSADENLSAKRYVITNPPDDMILLRTDKVLTTALFFSMSSSNLRETEYRHSRTSICPRLSGYPLKWWPKPLQSVLHLATTYP